MANERLLQYIASLTSEERERYRPFIDDALRLDRALTESMGEARANLERQAESLARIGETTERLQAALRGLNEKLAGLAAVWQKTALVIESGSRGNSGPGGSTLLH